MSADPGVLYPANSLFAAGGSQEPPEFTKLQSSRFYEPPVAETVQSFSTPYNYTLRRAFVCLEH